MQTVVNQTIFFVKKQRYICNGRKHSTFDSKDGLRLETHFSRPSS
jgi:hypothetical protein